MRQRVAAAVNVSSADLPSRLRRRTRAVTPDFSAASTRRRDAVIDILATSPTTAQSPAWRSASSMTRSTLGPSGARTCSSRLGARPAQARPGANRSGAVAAQSAGPCMRANTPATNRAAAAACTSSGPPPTISCKVPRARPPSGKCLSMAATPKGRMPPGRWAARSSKRTRLRRSSRQARVGGGLMFLICSRIREGSSPGLRAKKALLFLKKRSKKLLRIWTEPIRKSRSQTSKSFLVLFFKKEHPPFPHALLAA